MAAGGAHPIGMHTGMFDLSCDVLEWSCVVIKIVSLGVRRMRSYGKLSWLFTAADSSIGLRPPC